MSSLHTISLPESVIRQAWEDAFGTNSASLRIDDVLEGWSFLTSNNPEWRHARVTWCDMAGKNHEILRQQALARRDEYLTALERVRGAIAKYNQMPSRKEQAYAAARRRRASVGEKGAAA